MLISGACHCGNISFKLDWQPEPKEIPARACSCSFCVKHGGVWTSCPAGSLTVRVKDSKHVSVYAFGTKTAEFHVCSNCGIVPVVTSTIDGHVYAVVSVNAFENVDLRFCSGQLCRSMAKAKAIAWPGDSATGSVVSRSLQPMPSLRCI